MSEVKCNSCGTINDYRTEKKSNNLVAYCNRCGRFIKNIPHAEPALYIGKYSGKPIKEIEDLNYLQWAEKTLKLSSSQRAAILEKISTLEFLAK